MSICMYVCGGGECLSRPKVAETITAEMVYRCAKIILNILGNNVTAVEVISASSKKAIENNGPLN